MTKDEIIARLKTEFPTLTKSFDGVDFPMSSDEYDTQIELWADIEIEKAAEVEAEALKATEKQAILDRLGITADEAKLILA